MTVMGAITEIVQAILLGIGAVVFFLVRRAQQHPNVGWLRSFRFADRRTEEQKRRARRSANIRGGIQLIALGLALVPGYLFFSMMMFFSAVSVLEIAIVGAVSLLCIGFGISGIVRSGST